MKWIPKRLAILPGSTSAAHLFLRALPDGAHRRELDLPIAWSNGGLRVRDDKTGLKGVFRLIGMLALAGLVTPAGAQEVAIPDAGLNAAIREALQKPVGPLTEPDLLRLTNLSAGGRQIRSVEGLEAARNLRILDLDNNSISDFAIAGVLTNLTILDLFGNQLTNFVLSNALPSLGILDVSFNALGQCSLPAGLTNLGTLFLEGNGLTGFNLPAGLTALTDLQLGQNQLASLALPADLTNLLGLNLSFNQLTNLSLPGELHGLTELDLDFNRFTSLTLPKSLTQLSVIRLRANGLTNFNLPAELAALTFLDLSTNQLTQVTLPAGRSQLSILALSGNRLASFTLPAGLTNLTALLLGGNQLTNVGLPADLGHLTSLDLSGNQLAQFTVPAGLANLFGLFLSGNLLTNLTLPPDLLKLGALGYVDNPLTTLVLSETLAATNLRDELQAVRNQGVSVFTYPLSARLTFPQQQPPGAFRFGITGPPGNYAVLSSTNLVDWSVFGVATNPFGSIVFVDVTAHLLPQKFYSTLLQSPPTNMVFVAPNTFTMGSPNNEVGHQADEGPQTMVTLSRGFWIGKYEVTQREYVAVMGENPSGFPGDLDRPVESVAFFAASNYCVLLTQQDLAAGRIAPGSHYRLPTEAEWECAARAGTTTRFYYGDDPDLTGLSNFAWFGAHSGVTTHPVGLKEPNAWGLYDMEGNVWEWCQDWYGNYPGGSVADPQGPDTNPIGWKVIRGGAWESSEFDCRSASRWFEGASPFISDFIIGFRVVLVTDGQ